MGCVAEMSTGTMLRSRKIVSPLHWRGHLGNGGERHADRGAFLLTHRVGEAVQGRAARLSTGGLRAVRNPGTVTLARDLKSSES